jgi:thiosulfate dehydrogenase (quinone) large subunit
MSDERPWRPGPWPEAALVLLRMGIGWHLLYEGLVKLLSPGWTSAAFLAESRWLLSDVFHWIAAQPAVLRVVDLLNVWGLLLIGLGLLVGAFSRLARSRGSCCSRSTTWRAPPSSACRRTARPRAAT